MKSHVLKLSLILCLLGGLSACSDSRPTVDADLAITDVNVIAMNDDSVQAGQTVFIRDGLIVEIASSSEMSPKGATEIIEGGGGYLIPGLADMHVHIWSEDELLLYLANGVTLVRNMWGEPPTLAMREKLATGELTGPRMITAGKLTDGNPPIWGEMSGVLTAPEQVAAVMDQQQADGYDFFKVYSRLDGATFDRIAEHSKDEGFPFAGHVPEDVPLDRALVSGMLTIEHFTGWNTAIRPDNRPLAEGRIAGYMQRQQEANQFVAGELSVEQLMDEEKLARHSQLAAEEGVWNVPTLIVMEKLFTSRRQLPAEFEKPAMRYVSPAMKAMWNPEKDFRLEGRTDDDLEATAALSREINYALVKALHSAGAPMVAGSDAPNPFVIPGFSIHEELAHFVAAGLTPYEALVTATRAPARLLGELESSGTVEIGKAGNLVLLERNPLEDISATRDIEGVVLAGTWLSADTLDERLESLAVGYESVIDWFAGLEEPQGLTSEFELLASDSVIGASRLARTSEDGEADNYSIQSRWGEASNLSTQVISYNGSSDSVFSGIEFYESDSGKETSGTVVLDSGTVTMTRTENGETSTEEMALPANGLLLDSSEVGITALRARLESLAVGESRTFNVIALVVDDLTLVEQTWAITREAGDALTFRLTKTTDGDESEAVFTYDTNGLVEYTSFSRFGDFTVKRR